MPTEIVQDFALADYAIGNTVDVLTPALVLYPAHVRHNIATTIGLFEGDAGRWRPHVKTAKLALGMRMLAEAGVTHMKCATSLELRTACAAGASDVLVAFPHMGANAERIAALAAEFPRVRVSVLVEAESQMTPWRGTRVGLFLDINPGMDRTGIDDHHIDAVVKLAKTVGGAGMEFRGLHYYDGQIRTADLAEREREAHAGYDRLMRLVAELERAGTKVGELVTAGTPTFRCSLTYAGFRGGSFIHRASPGTIVYSDTSVLSQLPDCDYRPAVTVAARVISHPSARVITCDAGHKALSVDPGVPNGAVAGHPEFRPLKPSEEHLPIEIPEGQAPPALGEMLYLIPRHVCTTVNNFDEALLVEGGRIVGTARVTARGHEGPLASECAS